MGAGASSVPAIKDALKDVSDAQISGIISKLSAETRTKMLLALQATDDIASASLVPLEKLPESFSDIEGTRFAEVLRRGHMAVIKASYFKECLEKGEPFQDRSNIPAERRTRIAKRRARNTKHRARIARERRARNANEAKKRLM